MIALPLMPVFTSARPTCRVTTSARSSIRWTRIVIATAAMSLLGTGVRDASADGKVLPPRDYKGSLEEASQEAIIIFRHEGEGTAAKGVEDLILKVSVTRRDPQARPGAPAAAPNPGAKTDGPAPATVPAPAPTEGELRDFAWVIPFPTKPEIESADAALFRELFAYVQFRQSVRRHSPDLPVKGEEVKSAGRPAGVKVLETKVVGSFQTAVVQEEPGAPAGALNRWLEENNYQKLPATADGLLADYRRAGYVFACVKVADAALAKAGTAVDLHPLRFRFHTGGHDGIYFPMRLTGLQDEPFDLNLYVFYGKWINDNRNGYGYMHRGLLREWQDYDGPNCVADAGKSWSAPESDPYLRGAAFLLPTVKRFFQSSHPGARFYLTNLKGRFTPAELRHWTGDLWLFPYYLDQTFVPYDARRGGPAGSVYPSSVAAESAVPADNAGMGGPVIFPGVGLLMIGIPVLLVWWMTRRPGA